MKQCDRTTIHKNLFFSLLLGEVIFLAGIERTADRIGCGVVAGLLHYLLLCAFMWMLLEAYQLWRMLVEVFETETSRRKWYYASGYGLPLLVVVVSSLVDPFSYGTSSHCWLRADNFFVFSFVGPVICILAADFVLLAMAAYQLYHHQSTSAVMKTKEQSRLANGRTWIRNALLLLMALVLTWTFGLLYLDQGSAPMAYLFTIFNCTLALLVLVFHCVQNDKVRKEIRKVLRRNGCLSSECLNASAQSANGTTSTTVGKENQTSFYGSATSAPTLTAGTPTGVSSNGTGSNMLSSQPTVRNWIDDCSATVLYYSSATDGSDSSGGSTAALCPSVLYRSAPGGHCCHHVVPYAYVDLGHAQMPVSPAHPGITWSCPPITTPRHLFTFFLKTIHSTTKRFDSLLTQTPNGRSIPGGIFCRKWAWPLGGTGFVVAVAKRTLALKLFSFFFVY